MSTPSQWHCHPKAECYLTQTIKQYREQNKQIQKLETELLQKTSSCLFDWIDCVAISPSEKTEEELKERGFLPEEQNLWSHPKAQLPPIVIQKEKGIALCVDSISDFLLAHGEERSIKGSVLAPYRRCRYATENEVTLWIVERRGTRQKQPIELPIEHTNQYLSVQEKWKTRSRTASVLEAKGLAQELAQSLGKETAAWIVLEVEREYWQQRNLAGTIQKHRQDCLGMGWGNHDHHTFRSSRENFHTLVQLFEELGFHCRERFYAGEEAGWGAQVMESPATNLVLFLDVDLSPEEIAIDFAHQDLPEREALGTIGLWCALHGDSIQEAGMHHLEAQFQFDALAKDLKQWNIDMMDPFSDFPYLKQAFTRGEVWKPSKERVHALLEKELITKEQAEQFLSYGALGSHLENLQRKEGYKGFNQKNISYIIKKTDPRSQKNL